MSAHDYDEIDRGFAGMGSATRLGNLQTISIHVCALLLALIPDYERKRVIREQLNPFLASHVLKGFMILCSAFPCGEGFIQLSSIFIFIFIFNFIFNQSATAKGPLERHFIKLMNQLFFFF